jgi:formylglycine-generating enzyme required for sulfatase activity
MTNKNSFNYLAMIIAMMAFSGGFDCFADSGLPSPAPSQVNADMVLVPAGEFIMGTDQKRDAVGLQKKEGALNPYGFVTPIYVDEAPAHKTYVPAVMLDKFEVTNYQYKQFVLENQYTIPGKWRANGYIWTDGTLGEFQVETLRRAAANLFELDMDVEKMDRQAILAELLKIQRIRDRLPVTSVTWYDAFSYCDWAGKRLPNEAEWEKAARGPQNYEYPWGNDWDAKKANTGSGLSGAESVAVGSHPSDISYYGIYDMAGNVAEWVYDWYGAYPGSALEQKDFGTVHKVVRGGMAGAGHYDTLSYLFRSARRNHLKPDDTFKDVGFRCAKDAY